MLNNIVVWFTHTWNAIVSFMGGNPIVAMASVGMLIGGCISIVGILLNSSSRASMGRKGKL
jgi:hypothetical protein